MALGNLALGILALGILAHWVFWNWVLWHWVLWYWVYCPDTKQTNVWALARQNRPNFGMGQTERRERKFVQNMSSVAPDPPVCDPGPSGL